MDKNILSDYIDCCELLKETERDIRRLKKKRKTIVQTNVSGSNPEFPYNPQHFKIAGTTFTYEEDARLRMEEQLLFINAIRNIHKSVSCRHRPLRISRHTIFICLCF